mgnify:FL=1
MEDMRYEIKADCGDAQERSYEWEQPHEKEAFENAVDGVKCPCCGSSDLVMCDRELMGRDTYYDMEDDWGYETYEYRFWAQCTGVESGECKHDEWIMIYGEVEIDY